ncbi:MAG: HPr family phosphocarrier protein [Spirochaetaceae bacterium]|jgi:phosphocarrier protein HPr|nr:HPr family phosphocarrier protein [Spirochaetaceae bacterium]
MVKEIIEVTNPKGIHARPSSMLAQTALQFESEILLESKGNKANAGDIMSILTLGAFCGDKIEVTINGPDEQAAMEKIKEIFSLNFGDQ